MKKILHEMPRLARVIHPDIDTLEGKTVSERLTARAIVIGQSEEILLLYTKRYHDYSLPGGGVDPGEDIIQALKRELREETGAENIRNIVPFGIYDEFRPWYKDEADIQNIISYCYLCEADKKLSKTNYEDYEIANGMVPKWVELGFAIDHNKKTIAESDKKGMSIVRETFLLEKVLEHIRSQS